MGVKHFFIWLRNNFPDTIQDINHKNTFTDINVDIDNLCLDMNGIFHSCAQKIYCYGNYENKSLLRKTKYKKGLKWQLEFYKEVCNSIEFYRNMVKPKKRLILCVDGVAGFAKMCQQRQRRFRSQDFEHCDFDTSSLTPGTRIMENLSRYIEWYIRTMVSFSPDWKDIEIIYSGDKVPGEGEHKIINFIRHNNNSGDSYLIHGLDADLIMLSLATRNKQMYVLRENVRNNSLLHVVDIGRLHSKLSIHMDWTKQSHETSDTDQVDPLKEAEKVSNAARRKRKTRKICQKVERTYKKTKDETP